MRLLLTLLPAGRLLGAAALAAMTVLFGVLLLGASGALISRAGQHPESLLALSLLITGVRFAGLGRAAARYAERLQTHDLALRALAAVRARVFVRLTPALPGLLVRFRGGELLAGVVEDLDALQNAAARLVVPGLGALLVLPVVGVLLLQVSTALALTVLALLLLAGPGLAFLGAWAGGRLAEERATRAAALSADTLERLHGQLDLLAAGADLGALAQDGRRVEAVEERLVRLRAGLNAAQALLAGLGLSLALLLTAGQVRSGEMHAPLLAAVALGVFASFELAAGMGAAWVNLGEVRRAGRRVRRLLEVPPAVAEPVTPGDLPARGALRFENVEVAGVLDRVTLTLAPGERVALTGESGVGKSTLARLALRFQDPDAGRVSYGGTDARAVPTALWRTRLSLMEQDAPLLGAPLRENLRVADPAADDARLESLLTRLGLGDVLARLPGGLAGWVGEGGEGLSGGERARVALARALLKSAPVLILDEPTAHLDPAAEARVLEVICEELGDRALLLITHREAPLALAGRVLRLQGGALRELPTVPVPQLLQKGAPDGRPECP